MGRSIGICQFDRVSGGPPTWLSELGTAFPEGSVIVLLDGRSIVSAGHLSAAFMHAARRILKGVNRARDPSIEVIRLLSGSHQVQVGLERAGASLSSDTITVAVAPEDWPLAEDAVSMLPVSPVEVGIGEIRSLKPNRSGPEGPWAGPSALEHLGRHGISDPAEAELAAIEIVAICDL